MWLIRGASKKHRDDFVFEVGFCSFSGVDGYADSVKGPTMRFSRGQSQVQVQHELLLRLVCSSSDSPFVSDLFLTPNTSYKMIKLGTF